MAAKTKAILLVIFATLLTSIGQILWKFGSFHISSNLLSWMNPPLILGFLSYGLAAFILILALKHGQLSTLYPIIATSYIWVAVLSPVFFDDVLNLTKLVGITVIILGVTILTWGGK